MKKRFLVYICLLAFTSCAFAAQYKVNSKGQVKSPTGSIQQKSNITTPVYFNNYNQSTYVQNQIAANSSIAFVDIVMDYSGSMSYWIDTAKSAMSAIVSQIPNNVNVGFRVFGNDLGGSNPYNAIVSAVTGVKKDNAGKYKVTAKSSSYLGSTSSSCSSTESLYPVTTLNTYSLLFKMDKTRVGGMTPLTLALHQAVEADFRGFNKTDKKKIILITDGGENCGGDPCAFAKDLMSRRQDVIIDVVLVSSSSRALQCLASATGGKLYNPSDGGEFINSITNSIQNSENSSTDNTYTQYYEYNKDE